ncbi:histidine kinase [Streptomyces sp. N2-109]|uniref:histidine kinase n=1 Tax=Streptomyces gossypii TaxID=2883101 RepID=A0ABT2K1S6_9ACTN|nr:histidine kinase [Streptomyces gossypii]MCT2594098.1 histidine kinase [Streptomyces gossypii]
MRRILGRVVRVGFGVLAGSVTAVVEMLFLLLTGLCLLPVLGSSQRQRPVLARAGAAAGALTRLERRRLASFYGSSVGESYPPERALRYIAVRWAVGLLGALVLITVALGVLYATVLFWGWFLFGFQTPEHGVPALLPSVLGGCFLLFLGVNGLFGVATFETSLARRYLGPSAQDLLRRRISELASSRAGVLDVVHDEQRRIERYLHDGVQQQLVALGMLLGRARRTDDPARSAELVRQAHDEARRTLDELRDVAWRVYPAVLDEAGLHAALEGIAERSGLPVQLEDNLTKEPVDAVRTVAYFVVSEGVTNAAKHSRASHVSVRVTQHPGTLAVRVEDDGRGGADPRGGGLLGLARRVSALDGQLRVTSPPGGPTVLTAELPCD